MAESTEIVEGIGQTGGDLSESVLAVLVDYIPHESKSSIVGRFIANPRLAEGTHFSKGEKFVVQHPVPQDHVPVGIPEIVGGTHVHVLSNALRQPRRDRVPATG